MYVASRARKSTASAEIDLRAFKTFKVFLFFPSDKDACKEVVNETIIFQKQK